MAKKFFVLHTGITADLPESGNVAFAGDVVDESAIAEYLPRYLKLNAVREATADEIKAASEPVPEEVKSADADKGGKKK